MSDSDETVGSDSDETLPPDSRDKLNYSPDLFDEVNEPSSSHSNTEQTRMRNHQSKVHAMSDSESDQDTDITQKHNSCTTDRSTKVNQSTETNTCIPKSEPSYKTKDRQKFIKDFLGMFDSDSDEDSDKSNHSHDTNKKPAPKSDTKNKTLHKIEADHKKIGAPKSDIKTKTSKPVQAEHTSVTSKPHKKDYSKPYPESKVSHVTGSSNGDSERKKSMDRVKHGDGERTKTIDRVKHKNAEFNQAHKRMSDKESPSFSSALKRKHSRSPVPQELRKAVTEILNTDTPMNSDKPLCRYGSDCYRKNPSHLEEYFHPAKKSKSSLSPLTKDSPPPAKKQRVSIETPSSSRKALPVQSSSPHSINRKVEDMSKSPHSTNRKVEKAALTSPKTPKTLNEKFRQAQPYSFFLTKVSGIDDKFNSSYTMDIKEILSPDMGNLTSSCQFNFMFEIPWLIKQYPPVFRSKPLLIVHGEQGPSKAKLQGDAMTYTNIKFCQAKLEMMYGTHHTKMMLLLYDNGMRVVIHTSNLIEHDWFKKTQGIWISPIFPRLASPSKEKGESQTFFKRDLMNYIAAYKAYQLKEWIEHIEHHDMSSARVVIVGSVPGRHQGDSEKSKWGHLKLRKVLKQHGPDASTVKSWPVIGQFSSIGSMGPNKDSWVCGEFQESLATTKVSSGLQSKTRLQLIFPSKDNVRLSLEGFPAGGSIPYSVNTAKKQPYLHDFFHIWMSEGRGRSKAMPHIKTYIRPKQDGSMAAWFCVTSANLSKAAWGALEKKGVQLMIRSYEIGVLLLPKFFDGGDTFGITSDVDTAITSQKLILPYDLPTHKYEKKDRPWMWDIPYMDLPDTNGNVWCPFSK